MKVLHISSGLGLGGAERSLVHLCGALATAGEVSCAVANLTPADALAAQLPQAPWQYDLRHHPLRDQRALVAAARAYQPDVIHGWMYHGNLVASYVGSRCQGVPVIWSVRHSLEQLKSERREIRALIRLGASPTLRPQRVVYNSYSGWQTHAERGYGNKPSMIIPNGVNTNYFRPSTTLARYSARRRLGIPTEATVVGCVARFHPMKGLSTLLECLANLGHTQPVHLVLAGSGMLNSNAELAAQLAASGLSECTHCAGEVADMRLVYAALDMLVLPSLFGEGTPNVLLEAQASGVLTIASRVGDAARVIDRASALVQPGNAAQLATALRTMLATPQAERAALLVRQRQRMQRDYALDECHARYLALYRELAASRAA